MTLCIPTMDQAGLQARISTHFGRAPCYTLVDDDQAGVEVRVVLNHHAAHGHGQCSLPDSVASGVTDAVICRGIGRNALARLHERGIRVFVTEAELVEEGVRAFRGGLLSEMTAVEACHGGEHGAH
jgi:predicted Fe-Mo cluster-binding NifX family protein